MNLRLLFLINAVATFAAGVVLFVWPELIPGIAGIQLDRSAYFVCYLLGASEFAVTALCLLSLTSPDIAGLRSAVWSLVMFHTASGAAGVYAIAQGAAPGIWWNVVLRVLMVFLFVRYGLLQRGPRQ